MFKGIARWFSGLMAKGRKYPEIVHEKRVMQNNFQKWWKLNPHYKSRAMAEWAYMREGNQYDFRVEE